MELSTSAIIDVRARLITAAISSAPRLITITAPPGYGKTTLARALTARFGGARVVDDFERLERAQRALTLAGIAAGIDNGPWIVCSREPIDVPISRALTPSALFALDTADLRLRPEEIAAMFERSLDEWRLARAVAATAGWPLAVQLLLGADRLGRLDDALRDLVLPGQELLDQYVEQEVLPTLGGPVVDALCVLVALRGASVEEVAAVLEVDSRSTRTMLARAPLVDGDSRRLRVHRAMAAALRTACSARMRRATVRAAAISDAGRAPTAGRTSRRETVRLRVLSADALVEGRAIRLSPKRFALVAYLAFQRRPVADVALIDALWPVASAEDGASSLRVYANRVRTALGSPRHLVVERGRYALVDVETDLDEIDAFLRRDPARATASDVRRGVLLYAAARAGPPAVVLDLPAFASLSLHVADLADRLADWLAGAAASGIERERIAEALAAARDDEPAEEPLDLPVPP